MHAVCAFDCFSRASLSDDVVDDVDAPYHKHTIFGLYLAPDFSRQMFIARIDLARLQRAPEGADQSTAGGGHNIVERRRMRLGNLRADAVVLGDGPMHAESHRLPLRRQISQPQRAELALDTYARNIGDV